MLFVCVLRPVLARGLPSRASGVTWVVSRYAPYLQQICESSVSTKVSLSEAPRSKGRLCCLASCRDIVL
jgi:hypothetical protein